MRTVSQALLGGTLALLAVGAACAQPVAAASAPASASAPMTAASKVVPMRNPAILAAENAREPGTQRPEERVIPQISVPLKSRNIALPVATAASTAVGGRPGAIDDSAARCLAGGSAKERLACEAAARASEPSKASR